MDAKLTLKLDKDLIEKAKAYASSNNKSLSYLIEIYLKSLVDKEDRDEEVIQISRFVKGLSSGVKVPVDVNYKKEYLDHLVEKHT